MPQKDNTVPVRARLLLLLLPVLHGALEELSLLHQALELQLFGRLERVGSSRVLLGPLPAAAARDDLVSKPTRKCKTHLTSCRVHVFKPPARCSKQTLAHGGCASEFLSSCEALLEVLPAVTTPNDLASKPSRECKTQRSAY